MYYSLHQRLTAPLAGEKMDPWHGSYHWIYERIVAISMFGLIGAAMNVGPNKMLDFALGVVVPLHCHLGFSAIVTDYLPKRKFPLISPVAYGLLYAGTAATIYGLYKFNTTDVGIIEAVSQIWQSKQKSDEDLDD